MELASVSAKQFDAVWVAEVQWRSTDARGIFYISQSRAKLAIPSEAPTVRTGAKPALGGSCYCLRRLTCRPGRAHPLTPTGSPGAACPSGGLQQPGDSRRAKLHPQHSHGAGGGLARRHHWRIRSTGPPPPPLPLPNPGAGVRGWAQRWPLRLGLVSVRDGRAAEAVGRSGSLRERRSNWSPQGREAPGGVFPTRRTQGGPWGREREAADGLRGASPGARGGGGGSGGGSSEFRIGASGKFRWVVRCPGRRPGGRPPHECPEMLRGAPSLWPGSSHSRSALGWRGTSWEKGRNSKTFRGCRGRDVPSGVRERWGDVIANLMRAEALCRTGTVEIKPHPTPAPIAAKWCSKPPGRLWKGSF